MVHRRAQTKQFRSLLGRRHYSARIDPRPERANLCFQELHATIESRVTHKPTATMSHAGGLRQAVDMWITRPLIMAEDRCTYHMNPSHEIDHKLLLKNGKHG